MTSDKDTIARLKEEVRGLQQALAEERRKSAPKDPDAETQKENRELRRRIKELATYKEALNGNHQ